MFINRKMMTNYLDKTESGDNIHKHFSQFSSGLTHFKYGDIRSKRHHKGQFLFPPI